MQKDRTYFLAGIIISVTGALCFSSKAIFVKLGYQDNQTDVLTLLAVRMMGALPFFTISSVVALSNRENRKKLNARNLIQIIIIGFLGYYIASFLDFAGLQYVSAGLERLILFVYPTLVLLMSWQFFGQQISRNQWLAVAITYCGIILAFAGEYNLTDSFNNQAGDQLLTGSILILGCALAYAGYIVGSSRLIPKTGASLFNSLSMVAASIGILFHFFVFSNSDLQQITTQAWKYGLLMAVFATVIPSYLIAESIKRIGGENTAIIASIGPVSTILMAYRWLGEPITIWQILGTVCILAGVWMISARGKKTE